MATLNWGDLIKEAGEVASYEALPDGDYDLQIIEATATTSQSGKTMFKVTAEVQGGPHNKRRVWDNLVVSTDNSTALGIFFRKMAALGLGQEYFASNPTNAQIEQTLVGRQFRAKIGSRVWQGDKKNEIKSYYAARAAEYDRVYLKPQGTWHQNRVDSESIDAPHPARLARPFRIAHFFGLVHSPSAVAVRVIARSGGAAV